MLVATAIAAARMVIFSFMALLHLDDRRADAKAQLVIW
jgi:hypothetical protein